MILTKAKWNELLNLTALFTSITNSIRMNASVMSCNSVWTFRTVQISANCTIPNSARVLYKGLYRAFCNSSCKGLNTRITIRICRTCQVTGHSEETQRPMFWRRPITVARGLCGLPVQHWNRQFEPHLGHKYMLLRIYVVLTRVISGLLAIWHTGHGFVPNVYTHGLDTHRIGGPEPQWPVSTY
jgi:hypothetical protein